MSGMARYFGELKKKHGEAVILFRMDDRYEAYYEDAKAVADTCGLELKREDGNGGYMAAFPYGDLSTCLPKLVRAGKRIAICDGIINEPIKEDETMRLNMDVNNQKESANVQPAAPVNNPASVRIEDAEAVEVTEVDDIVPVPVVKPKADSAPEKPRRDKSGKFVVNKTETEPAPKAEAEQPTQGVYSVTTYQTKKGGTAALLFGFASKEAAEKMAEKMAKSISASWRYGQDGEKRHCISVGTRYVDVAKALCSALNSDDKAAVAKACKDSIAIYDGVVADGKAAREARKQERQSAKPAETAANTYTDKDVADMLRKVMAGGDVPEDIKKLLKAA